MFFEIIEIKNPSSSLERRKIVQLANEQMNYRYETNLNEKLVHLKSINKEYSYENNSNIKKTKLSKINSRDQNKIDKKIIEEISDFLSGLASYSLFIEAVRLLQIIASKIVVNHQNELNLYERKKVLSTEDNDTANKNLIEVIDAVEKVEIVHDDSDSKTKKSNTKNEKWDLSFPFVYGQTHAKQALLEALLWPRKYTRLYRLLSPTGL